jgi:hypothetical protein
MQQFLSLIVAATALATPTSGTGAIATSAPVAVSTCTVTDLYNGASVADLGLPLAYRTLRVSFRNTDDTVATRVAFDVTHDGERTTVIDSGRFSKGVAIDHSFVTDFSGSGYSRIPDSCAVASITFADGRRWSAPSSVE